MQQNSVEEEAPQQQPQQPPIVRYSLSHFHNRRRRHHSHGPGPQRPPHHHHHDIIYGGHNNDTATTNAPSALEMNRRQTHRQQILASTETHLRRHEGTNKKADGGGGGDGGGNDEMGDGEKRDTSRNILYVLADRERRGPRHVISWSRYRRFQQDHHRHKLPLSTMNNSSSPPYGSGGPNAGDRSPSTVLESPPPREEHHHGLAPTSSSLLQQSASSGSMMAHHHHHHLHHQLSGGGSSLIIMEDQETSYNATEEEEEEGDEDHDEQVTPRSPPTTRQPWPSHSPPVETTTALSSSNSLRRVTYPLNITREVQSFAEYASAVRYHSACLNHLGGDDIIDADGNRPVSSHAVSTISIAFSGDGRTVASTHGDHTVKISCCITGVLLQSLDGHPRTPWTVKYHPINPHVLASGCLGHQVRVWDWPRKVCLQMVRLEFAIISLAFHPTGELLAIANGTKLHFWGINNHHTNNTTTTTTATTAGTNNNTTTNNASSSSSSSSSSRLMESDQKHMLRCVHFPPSGDTIIIGGANPMQDDPRTRQQQRRHGNNNNNNSNPAGNNGMSFYLRLWDFDLERALDLPSSQQQQQYNNNAMATNTNHHHNAPSPPQHHHHIHHHPHDGIMRDSIPFGIAMGRRSISNPRTFVPRALLYNDGGFDVSPDGKKLCVCAEYWLPDGVDNVMEQLHHEERLFEASMRVKDEGNNDDSSLHDLLHNNNKPSPERSVNSSTEEQQQQQQQLSNNSLLPHNLFSHNSANLVGNVPRTPGNSSPEGYHGHSGSLHNNNNNDNSGDNNSNTNASGSGGAAGTNMTMNNSGSASSSFMLSGSFVPTTPPVSVEPRDHNLSPPPPPGRRPTGGGPAGILRHARESVSTYGGQPVPTGTTPTDDVGQDHGGRHAVAVHSGAMGRYSRGGTNVRGVSTPPPPPPHAPVAAATMRPPHPFSIISPAVSSHGANSGTPTHHHHHHHHHQTHFDYSANRGRYVPHIAMISIDPSPTPESVDGVVGRHSRNKPGSVARGYKPRLGQLMEAIPLDPNKATAVTCVKFSPSTDFCLIGYGVRQPGPDADTGFHPVTAVYRIRGGMTHVSTMLSKDDDVNIARFHPDSGHGIVYGTKQGRVRVLSPRPWNFY